MNGQRVIRKYIERLSDKDLHGLYEAAKKDSSQEAVIIQYLIMSELEHRKKQP